ncbi:CCHC-type zinc finger transcription factor [Phycomyces blakesleeanus NRRL 1555(-)]|uniref:CCHC-type zinc finger transcription factor n=1 Tax=Phycomyces blakesleeanus (strain ATCC 8743b / DSM 1359 / FGSC 10004 / NBRC 33097 / NRRL 1555) TaxID=763407 RepID=A0A167QTD0_PHYB8|nr:CCHC-type zinc finger transcription factor [Phycomyces blakesleeanus NRRL 1555(-)]OAD80249.1 CCHC-type zinc finger transcription factor [Phycomyces blakesleeanus NRRL 1555(-)]|eukprot:XP_018298289.1 CCHC-type zinc finger transcription factor [Phycomyces blakesleeanus NRRL 1555(-)]
MSLGQLTININVHKSGTTCHGSLQDQTIERTHRPVSITRNWPKPHSPITYVIMNSVQFTDTQKKKFEIKKRVQALLPAELASSFAASHTVPSLPEEQHLHSSSFRIAFWDTQAQNMVAKLSGVPVSTPPSPDSLVHIPVPSSLPMSTPPAPVNLAAPAALAAMTMPKLIAAFTAALCSSQLPAAYTALNPVPAPVSLPPLVQIERPDFYHGACSANAIDGWVCSVERFAELHRMDYDSWTSYAITLLRDGADVWWHRLEDNDRICSLHQTGSVESYIDTFQDLRMDIPSMTEDEALERFVSVRFWELLDLAEAARTALAFENSHCPVPTFRPEVVLQYVCNNGPTPMDLDAMEWRGLMRTNYQGCSGQRSNQSSASRSNVRPHQQGGRDNRKCFWCGQIGHLRHFCSECTAAICQLDEG